MYFTHSGYNAALYVLYRRFSRPGGLGVRHQAAAVVHVTLRLLLLESRGTRFIDAASGSPAASSSADPTNTLN